MGPCPLVAGVSHVSVSLNVSLSVCPPPPQRLEPSLHRVGVQKVLTERENLTLTPVWVPACRRRLGCTGWNL